MKDRINRDYGWSGRTVSAVGVTLRVRPGVCRRVKSPTRDRDHRTELLLSIAVGPLPSRESTEHPDDWSSVRHCPTRRP